MLKYADNFVNVTIDAHGFPEGVRVGKEGFADGRAQHDDRPCVLLIESADESAALDAKQRNRLRVLRLRAAYDYFFDAVVTADDAVAISEKEAPCAKGRDDPHVGRGLADKFGVVVFKILARSNPFRQSGRVRAEGKSRDRRVGKECRSRWS